MDLAYCKAKIAFFLSSWQTFHMDQFINSIPRPILVILVLLLGIGSFFYLNPPHTVCDTEFETFIRSQRGVIFPSQVKKRKIPPLLTKARNLCREGNSSGACYEYFKALRGMSRGILDSSSECRLQIYENPEIQKTLKNGMQLIVNLAWGESPPETTGLEKLGWFGEFDVATYCSVKNSIFLSIGEEAWIEFRNSLMGQLPGEKSTQPNNVESVKSISEEPSVAPRKKAIEFMSQQDVFSKSIFSVRCENFN